MVIHRPEVKERVKELLRKGLSIAAIARVLDGNVTSKTIWRWSEENKKEQS